MTHPLAAWALEAIRRHLGGEPVEPEWTEGLDPLPWGVFVSLHDRGVAGTQGALRGCIGRLELADTSLATEVAQAAVSSATADPRFRPLCLDEVDDLEVTVYLLDAPQVVEGPADLDPAEFGVIVTDRSGRRGLLLPGIPGIDTPEQQLQLAVRKAGLSPGSDVIIERFTALILR